MYMYMYTGLQISAGHRTFVRQIWGFYRSMLSLTGHADWALQLWREMENIFSLKKQMLI